MRAAAPPGKASSYSFQLLRPRVRLTRSWLDLTVYGRQEKWEDSPTGWPQENIMDTLRTDGRPTSQWSRLKAGYSDDLGTGRR